MRARCHRLRDSAQAYYLERVRVAGNGRHERACPVRDPQPGDLSANQTLRGIELSKDRNRGGHCARVDVLLPLLRRVRTLRELPERKRHTEERPVLVAKASM